MLTNLLDTHPHIFDAIVDSIFNDQDIKTLLRLRLTCRVLQLSVDEVWGHLAWQFTPRGCRRCTVSDRKGRHLPVLSPFLCLTTVLDLCVSPTTATDTHSELRFSYNIDNTFPRRLKLQVLRIVMYDVWCGWATRLPVARVVVICDAWDVRPVMSSMSPDLETVDVVLKLDYASVICCCHPLFDYTGPCSRTNVFILLSDCDPADTYLGGLWEGIVETVAENIRFRKQTFFYLVEVSSWFAEPEDEDEYEFEDDDSNTEEPRMDQILEDPDEFFEMIWNTHQAFIKRSCLSADDLDDLAAAGCQCSRFIQRISLTEMRWLLGEKANTLAHAPVNRPPYLR